MKILVICESLDPNTSSGAKGRVALIKSFVKSFDSVTVVHYSHKQIVIEGANCFLAKESKTSFFYLLSRMQRKLYSWFGIDVVGVVDRIFGFSFGFFNDVKSISRSLKKLKEKDFDSIWTLSNGNSYRSHRVILNMTDWHSKWYAYIHDPYPQQLYPRPFNYVPYGFKQKRRFLTKVTVKSKRVVFPSLLLKKWMESYYVEIKDKSLIIPHQLDKQIESKSLFPDYFNDGNFNILHAGNLLDLRDPKPIINAFIQFINKTPVAREKARLIFLGKKSIFSKTLNEFAKQYPQIYASEDYVEFDEVFNMQKNADVNVILEANSEISPFLPGKFPHCVNADKPILAITPYYSETKRLLGVDYPYVVDFDDEFGILNSFDCLFKKWSSNGKTAKLDRADLSYYLSSIYMKEQIVEDKIC